MGPSLFGVFLLFSLSTFSTGSDFQPGSEPLGRSVFVRRSNAEGIAAKIAKRSLSSSLMGASPNHRIRRRSADQQQGGSCQEHQGFKSKLDDNTHDVSFLLQVEFHIYEPREEEEDAQVLKPPAGAGLNLLFKVFLFCQDAQFSTSKAPYQN